MPSEFVTDMKPVLAYCDCHFPNCIELSAHSVFAANLVKCRCGEENSYMKSWKWQENLSTDAQIENNNVIFHPTFSQGTAIVRGNKSLDVGMIHFWEMRMLTAVAGTDVMFGIGTDKVNVNEFQFHFIGALGINSQSWGYSYHGEISHNGKRNTYGVKFSQGCILGILLDRSNGTMKFYINRRSLGIAYTNIPMDPNVKIYPMVCSTAAKSSIRLMNATSVQMSLKYIAYKALVHNPEALAELQSLPGLRHIVDQYWFLRIPVRYSQLSPENELDIADEAILSNQSLRSKQKLQVSQFLAFVDDPTDINDLYANTNKIVRSSSEDDLNMNDMVDEYFHYLF